MHAEDKLENYANLMGNLIQAFRERMRMYRNQSWVKEMIQAVEDSIYMEPRRQGWFGKVSRILLCVG